VAEDLDTSPLAAEVTSSPPYSLTADEVRSLR